MDKILAPIDGSKHSLKALEVALDLAKKYNSKLFVISVVSDILPNLDYKSDIIDKNKIFSEEIIERIKNRYDFSGIDANFEVVLGDVAREIVNYSEEKDVDLIVMGSRGLGIVPRTLLGSISNKVTNLSSKSIYIVK